jgi:hypothetical protein
VQIGTGRREIFEFCDLRKNPLRDLHRFVEHPDRLNKKLLEKKDSQEGIHISPFVGEREGRQNPVGV